MNTGTNEGELVIQSPEITSTIPSFFHTRYYNVYGRRPRPTFPSRTPILWLPNQEHPFPRSALNAIPSLENNGPGSGARVSRPTHLPYQPEGSTQRAVIIVLAIFLSSVLALIYIYMMFPELEKDEVQYVKIPWDIEDAKKLGKVLDHYKDKYFFEVVLAVIGTYIFLQTFAIPGSISLSILSGFLFPFPIAIILVCFCSATGASLCYVLSHFLGRRLVYKYFPERVKQWALTVNRHRHNITNYIIFLRITPFLPNWFINIAAPIIDVPLKQFWIGTFVGVAPPSFLAIQAGQTLHTLTSTSQSLSWYSVILLAIFAVGSMVPVLFRKQLKDAVE